MNTSTLSITDFGSAYGSADARVLADAPLAGHYVRGAA